MATYIALDIGSARTGVAVSHDGVDVPVSLDSIQSNTTNQLIDSILELVTTYNPAAIIIGHPLLFSGSIGKQAKAIESITGILTPKLPATCSIELIDERFSSTNTIGLNKDAVAAIRLLQVYLDKK